MYIYTSKHVTTVDEYIQAIADGYCNIICPPSIRGELIDKLEQYQNLNDDYLFEYGKILSQIKEFDKANKIFLELDKRNNPRASNAYGISLFYGEGVEKDIEKAMIYYKKAVEQGYAIAENNLALAYRNGFGVEKDEEHAFELFKKSAEQGYAKAQVSLGYCYEAGAGVEKDPDQAVYWYRQAAEQDYAAGQYYLGCAYEYGDGVKKDPKQAVYWYTKAAEQGNASSQVSLGYCYEVGFGVEENPKQAFYWYKKAAEKDNKDAQVSLGWCYEEGIGVEKDPDQAFYWYKLAAEKGHPKGQMNLGWCYQDGIGVEKDPKLAFYWFNKASTEHDYDFAQVKLALCYQEGIGVEKDLDKAIYWFKKAAEKEKNAWGKISLAWCYEDGIGVEKDLKQAFYWFKKAAELGDDEAQYNVALYYQDGTNVKKSPKEAFKWFKKSAEQGNSEAQVNLGLYYENGTGVGKSYSKAFEWYKKSAEQGNDHGQFCLALCYKKGRGVEKDEEHAFELLKKSAEQGSANGQWKTGECYYLGSGVEKDYKKAVYWFKKSSEQGHPIAYAYLGTCYLTGSGIKKSSEKGLFYLQKSVDLECMFGYAQLSAAYEEGEGVERDLQKTLSLLKKAQELGGDVKEDLERINKKIEEEKHSLSKVVPHDIDIFISWNHNDLNVKEEIKNNLELNNIKVWESDESCEGDLDSDVKYAINRAKGYVVILSMNALTSSYMPLEMKMMFERLEEDNLGLIPVKVYTIGDYSEISKGVESLGKDHHYHKLLSISKDFSNDITHVVKFAKEMVRRSIVINYQKSLNARFDVFPISLSETIIKQGNVDVSGSLDFESGYINRDLVDKDNKRYNTKALLKLEGVSLIHGEGGSGKSLYLKNLIKNNNSDKDVFFYLPCSEIYKEYLKDHNVDLISLISKIALSITSYHDISLNLINDIFRNDKKNFYIVFDALDEASEIKDVIIKMVNTFNSLSISGRISFIFTTRSPYDADLIHEITNKNVASLQLSDFTDEDAIKLFDAVYERNSDKPKKQIKKKMDRGEVNRDMFINRPIDREAFISCLKIIAEDIKKNPLLISNLIYIYFATRELQTQRSYILEKSNEILINSLEKERGTILDRQQILKELNINLGDLLEFLAFRMSCDEQTTIEDAVRRYQVANINEEPKEDDISSLARYLRNRRIIIGNRFSHNIYLSYFAARYIFKRVYQHFIDEDFDEDYLDFIPNKGLANLNKYIESKFVLDTGMWPSVTLDFISKLDYEIHYIKDNRESFDETKRSYSAFDASMKALSKGIGKIATQLLKEMIENTNIFYYALLIKNYFAK